MEWENENVGSVKRLFEVLPVNTCFFYLPQNSGPDNILKGNDDRLKIPDPASVFPHTPTSLY